MIKVYNKQSNYLRVSGKVIAPFKTEEFEERNQQIRILERNGIVAVTEDLSNNTIPTTSNVVVDNGEGEPKTEIETIIEDNENTSNEIVEDTVVINEEDIIPEDIVNELKQEEIQDVKAEKIVVKKTTKRKTKKGGNK